MSNERDPRDQGIDPENRDKGVNAPSSSMSLDLSHAELQPLQDAEIDRLIEMLSRPTQALTADEYLVSIAKRQEAVDKHLFRGGADTLRRFFERIRQLEGKQPIRIDLSTLEISGKLLSGLYLPGANLEKLIFTDSDLTGANLTAANLTAANLTAAIGIGAIMRGAIATGAKFTDAHIPDADLSGGRFIGCTFINANLTDIKVDKDTNFAGSRFIGTYLSGVNLSVANTTGAVFRGVRR